MEPSGSVLRAFSPCNVITQQKGPNHMWSLELGLPNLQNGEPFISNAVCFVLVQRHRTAKTTPGTVADLFFKRPFQTLSTGLQAAGRLLSISDIFAIWPVTFQVSLTLKRSIL